METQVRSIEPGSKGINKSYFASLASSLSCCCAPAIDRNSQISSCCSPSSLASAMDRPADWFAGVLPPWIGQLPPLPWIKVQIWAEECQREREGGGGDRRPMASPKSPAWREADRDGDGAAMAGELLHGRAEVDLRHGRGGVGPRRRTSRLGVVAIPCLTLSMSPQASWPGSSPSRA